MKTWTQKFLAIAVGLSAVAALTASGEKTSKDTPASGDAKAAAPAAGSETDDVKVESCSKNSSGFGEANLTITNNSSKPSSYIVSISFETPDGTTRLDEGAALVSSLQPGQTTAARAGGLKPLDTEVTCKVANVTRTATPQATDELDDVKIEACGNNDSGYAKADLEVTNNSSKKSNYLIGISFESSDGKTRLGEGNTVVNNLDPGQAAKETAGGFEKLSADYTCKVSTVQRLAST